MQKFCWWLCCRIPPPIFTTTASFRLGVFMNPLIIRLPFNKGYFKCAGKGPSLQCMKQKTLRSAFKQWIPGVPAFSLKLGSCHSSLLPFGPLVCLANSWLGSTFCHAGSLDELQDKDEPDIQDPAGRESGSRELRSCLMVHLFSQFFEQEASRLGALTRSVPDP